MESFTAVWSAHLYVFYQILQPSLILMLIYYWYRPIVDSQQHR